MRSAIANILTPAIAIDWLLHVDRRATDDDVACHLRIDLAAVIRLDVQKYDLYFRAENVPA